MTYDSDRPVLTPTQLTIALHEARGWLADCFGRKAVRGLGVDELISAINRHYDGGWVGFLLSDPDTASAVVVTSSTV